MIMTTECGGKAEADAKLTMAALEDADVEIKRETPPPPTPVARCDQMLPGSASPPSPLLRPPPSISLKSVQEKLSRFGSTVKFRTEAAGGCDQMLPGSDQVLPGGDKAPAEDESCQPQDLSVRRRDQGSQTDCDNKGRDGEKKAASKVTIRKMSQKPSSTASEAVPASASASELEKMLRIWYLLRSISSSVDVVDVVFRRLAAAGAVERKSDARLPKVEIAAASPKNNSVRRAAPLGRFRVTGPNGYRDTS